MPALNRFLKNHWPIAFLTFISLVIFLTNYVPGTYLLGWDNTVPELNLFLNLKRVLSGVWQEYRGLGTLDGMSHTANIVHWAYIALLSLVLPANIVRYAFILLSHLVGGVGVYYLIKKEILPTLIKKGRDNFKLISLIGALIYQLNFMTVQMFYVPLELFVIHFAILPWGLLTLTRYLKTRKNKDLVWFFVVNILGVSQAHVPTIVIPYLAILGIFLINSLLINFNKNWKAVAVAGLVLFSANAFWGVPYIYSTLNKSAEIVQSKQNRLGTPGTFYRNLAWTDLRSISTFGGFRLDYSDWNLSKGEFHQILEPWIPFYESSSYQLISIFISILSLIGLFLLIRHSFKYKTKQHLPYIFGWLFALTMLGTNLPIIKNLIIWLSNNLPVFEQLFRFTFTKFSIIYVFFVSILASVSLSLLIKIKFNQILSRIIYVGIISLVFYLAHPIFNGYFFYPALRLKLPSQYSELATYTNKKFPDSRIINFPIHSLWGWTTGTHNWGYRGSGFTWQMINQPLVDRSFDPWSKYNETMFLQTNLALYQQDQSKFLNTLNKYHTDLILNDNSIFHPGNYPENLFSTETHLLFNQISQINLDKENFPLQLYKVDSPIKSNQLYAPKQISVLNNNYTHTYTSVDQAYADHGNYILDSKPDIIYPFSYLQQEGVNSPEIINNHFIYELNDNSKQQLQAIKFADAQKQVVGVLTARVENNQVAIETQVQIPEIVINNKPTTSYKQEIKLAFTPTSNYIVQFDKKEIKIDPHTLTAEPSIITYLFIPTQKNMIGMLVNEKEELVTSYKLPINDWINEIDNQLVKIKSSDQVKIIIPLGENEEFIFSNNPDRNDSRVNNCSRLNEGDVSKTIADNSYFYSAKNKGVFCDTYYFSEINEELQYLFHWQGNVGSGAGVSGSLLNPDTKRFDLNIGSNKKSFNEWYTVYPSKNTYHINNDDLFGFNISGESYGGNENKLNLKSLEFYPLPLNWLTKIYSQTGPKHSLDTQINQINKIGTFFYSAQIITKSPTGIIVLPQSYDRGWLLFKWPLNNNSKHIIFNGWANAWEVPAGEHEIIIFYWPQLLVFGGYGLLVGTGIYLIKIAIKEN
jgi:hypothetical protein